MGSMTPPADRPGGPRLAGMRVRALLPATLFAVFLATACDEAGDDPAADASEAQVDASEAQADAVLTDGLENSVDAPPSGGVDASSDAIATALCPEPPPTEVIDVTVGDLHGLIGAEEALAVVDVREPSETAGGIIEGALLYPWNTSVLQADHATLPDDVPLFVICRSGSRSAQATQFLVNNGHTCVHNVLGGMNAWTDAGYPTVSP